MIDSKRWYQSRIIWVQIVAIAFMVLKFFGVVPDGITEDNVVEAIVTLIAFATILLRHKTTTVLGPPG